MPLILSSRLNYRFQFSYLFKLFSKANCNNVKRLFFNENIYFTNSASTGLKLLLNSMGLKKGSRIGVQIYNCDSVFSSIVSAGHVPVFIDINDDYSISLEDLQAKKKDIDVLIVTHLFGFPQNIENIKSTCNSIPIIEDCAHSFLSELNSKLTGTFTDAAIFSFGSGKFPSIGNGGFVIINNIKYVNSFNEKYINLKELSIAEEFLFLAKRIIFAILHLKFIYGLITYPLLKKNRVVQNKPTNKRKCSKLALKIFCSSLDKFEQIKELNSKNALPILSKLNLSQLRKKNSYNPNYFMLPVKVENVEDKLNLALHFGHEFGQHFKDSVIWASKYGYNKGDCLNAEKVIPNTITIPCYRNISTKLIDSFN